MAIKRNKLLIYSQYGQIILTVVFDQNTFIYMNSRTDETALW